MLHHLSVRLTPTLTNRLGKTATRFSLALLTSLALAGPHALASTNLQFKAEVSVKETFDSNVYLQDKDPVRANADAATLAGLNPVEANRSSWVTAVLPKIGLDYKPTTVFNLSAAYIPDVNFYHSANSEDYVAHRATLNLGGKVERTSWELLSTAAYIDGGLEGPTFARPDDIPALGGIPLRDRREAFIFRNSFRLAQSFGDWFVRPLASSYVHDFKTHLRYTPAALRSIYAYENYIDRQDVSGGLDLGYRFIEGTFAVLGYRYGQQEQFLGPYGSGGALIDSPFDSSYHRVLVGVEGSPVKWLKLNFLIGPDFRDFSGEAHRMYPAFDPDTPLYFLDAAVTVIPTGADTITFRSTRFEMPAFSSFSVYEDIKNDLVWRHQFDEKLAAAVGFTLYIGDWQPPAHRNDWIYTPNVSLTYAFTSKLSAEAAYSYDWVDSFVSKHVEPLTESHEFTRHLATVGLRYAF